jgi:hypothetical protein
MTDQEIARELLSIARLLTKSKGDADRKAWQATTRIAALAAQVLGAKDSSGRRPALEDKDAGTAHRLMSFEAARWMSLRLAAGPVPRTELAAEALQEGFTAAMIARAMEELGVKLSQGPDGRLLAASLGDGHDAKKNGSVAKS